MTNDSEFFPIDQLQREPLPLFVCLIMKHLCYLFPQVWRAGTNIYECLGLASILGSRLVAWKTSSNQARPPSVCVNPSAGFMAPAPDQYRSMCVIMWRFISAQTVNVSSHNTILALQTSGLKPGSDRWTQCKQNFEWEVVMWKVI